MKKYFVKEIKNSSLTIEDTKEAWEADHLARELVLERSEKELIDVIRWLIMDRAKVANEYLEEE